MTRTRCPACSTVFRVTSDQLRAKAGKVRCGYCQTVFNAFDGLLPEAATADQAVAVAPVADEAACENAPATPPAASEIASVGEPEIAAAEQSVPQDTSAQPEPESITEDAAAPTADAVASEIDEIAREVALIASDVAPPQSRISASEAEETTLAARQAGLVAARELSEIPAYDRWAAGTLSGAGAGGLAGAAPRRPGWPLVLAALLLSALLLMQFAYHFRSDLVRLLPPAADLFAALSVPVPLPAHSDLVSIEASDLQADNARDLFILDAALRNRAAYEQAWPALELTLTDAGDAPVARRVMAAADYLPAGSDLSSFPANAEIPVRLWIDAKGLGASGYRLYIFYP